MSGQTWCQKNKTRKRCFVRTSMYLYMHGQLFFMQRNNSIFQPLYRSAICGLQIYRLERTFFFTWAIYRGLSVSRLHPQLWIQILQLFDFCVLLARSYIYAAKQKTEYTCDRGLDVCGLQNLHMYIRAIISVRTWISSRESHTASCYVPCIYRVCVVRRYVRRKNTPIFLAGYGIYLLLHSSCTSAAAKWDDLSFSK